MQQALYNTIRINHSGRTAGAVKTTTRTAARRTGIARWIACRWDLVGVLALMGSSAAYGMAALAHLGL